MYSLHSPRKAASPVAIVGASCVAALLTLTGCGDDDKPASPPPPPSMEMPSLRPLPSAPSVPGISTGASASEPAKNSAAGSPSPSGTTPYTPRIKLQIGECIDLDNTGNLIKVPCTIPHYGEVAALYTLPETTDPSGPTYKADVNAKCEELLTPVQMRQTYPNLYDYVAYHPSARSWANDRDRELACIMTGKKKTNIPGRLK
jgi:hypothetical protein